MSFVPLTTTVLPTSFPKLYKDFWLACCVLKHSSFVDSIKRVCSWRIHEQMVRSAAGAVVALVKHPKPVRNRAVVDNPRKLVRVNLWHLRTLIKCSVPLVCFTGSPNPTLPKMRHMFRDGSVLVNVSPEPFLSCVWTCIYDWFIRSVRHNVLSRFPTFCLAASGGYNRHSLRLCNESL